MIKVEYVCECGNRVSVHSSQKPYECASKVGYIPVDKNIEIICGGCGQTMKLEVFKKTTETKTETIRKENQWN